MASRGVAVLTRDDISGYREALAAIDIAALALPVTTFAPPADPGAIARAFAKRRRFHLLVASPRAAAAVVAVGDAGAKPLSIWAIGAATAKVLTDAGLAVRTPDRPDADALALAEAFRAAFPRPARVVVPRAEGGRDGGIAHLRNHGYPVEDVVAYRTVAIDRAAFDATAVAALAADPPAIACLFAPSQVTALGDFARPHYAAIGRTTAAALEAAGVPAARIAVAATPTPAGLAAAIQTVYPSRR